MSRQDMYGNDRSSVQQPASTSRASGPQSPRQAQREVTSRTSTPSPAWRAIQARSWRPNAVPVTIQKRSSASRATVKSHSIPPRELSICV